MRVTTYKEADQLLQGRNIASRKLQNHTYLQRRADSIAVRLHNTDVVTYYPDGRVKLDSGGWRAHTTKERINNFAPVRIWQRLGLWYVNNDTLFEDGMTIEPNGKIKGGLPVSKTKKLLAFRKEVRQFASEFTDAFLDGKVPKPGLGDCFYCGLRDTATKKPVGDVFQDQGHLRSHVEEKYFVPSLLWNALEFCGASIATKQTVQAIWEDKPEHMFWKKEDEYFRAELRKYIARYMIKHLGQAA